MKYEKITCECATNPLKLSKAQQSYLVSGTYEITSIDGNRLLRELKVIGVDPGSGDALVLESYTDIYPYKKLFIVSPEGNTEKYKGQRFQNVS